MEDTSGFYFKDENGLYHAPNGVHAKDFTLTRETKDETPEAGGWKWFNSLEEAEAYYV